MLLHTKTKVLYLSCINKQLKVAKGRRVYHLILHAFTWAGMGFMLTEMTSIDELEGKGGGSSNPALCYIFYSLTLHFKK